MKFKNLAFAAALLLVPSLAQPQARVGTSNRGEAIKIIAGLCQIVSPQGLQAIETNPIGGIKQVVSIRSQDLRNPVTVRQRQECFSPAPPGSGSA